MWNTTLNDEVLDFYCVLIAPRQFNPFKPAHIAAQIFCGHSVEGTHPPFQFAVDRVDVLYMVYSFLVLSTGNTFVVQRKVPCESIVTFMAVCAYYGIFPSMRQTLPLENRDSMTS